MEQGGVCIARAVPQVLMRQPSIMQPSSHPGFRALAPKFSAVSTKDSDTGNDFLPSLPPLVHSSSSSTDNSPKSGAEHVQKGRKRNGSSNANSLRPRKLSRIVSSPPTRSSVTGNFAIVDFTSSLGALDGTPLGKLLRATPEIQVDPQARSYARGGTCLMNGNSPYGNFQRTSVGGGFSFDKSYESRVQPLVPPLPSNSVFSEEGPKPSFSAGRSLATGPPPTADSNPSQNTSYFFPAPTNIVGHGTGQEGRDEVLCTSNLLSGITINPPLSPSTQPRTVAQPETRGQVQQSVGCPPQGSGKDYLGQVFGRLGDPRMVTDGLNEFLWTNMAFRQVTGAGGAAGQGAAHVSHGNQPSLMDAPTVDPSRENSLQCAPWGLSKLPASTESSVSQQHPESSAPYPRPEQPQRMSPAKVLAPQPVRAIGSAVLIESLGVVEHFTPPATGSYEAVYREFEEWSLPVMLTDKLNRIRWVNSRYEQLIGQPECPWLAAALGAEAGSGAARLKGEVKVSGIEGLALAAPALTCFATIQWTNGGQSRSVRIPGVATRLDSGTSLGVLGYVWQFQV